MLIGDPGRTYLPKDRLARLAEYSVPVTRELEDLEIKRTTVWELIYPSSSWAISPSRPASRWPGDPAIHVCMFTRQAWMPGHQATPLRGYGRA